MKKDDLVKIINHSTITQDISWDFTGYYAYIDEIDDIEHIALVQICGTDIRFWINIDYLQKTN